MMRRVSQTALCVSGARAIATYEFGHPPLNVAYTKNVKQTGEQKDHKVQISKLGNGVRVVSHNLDGATSSVGAYIDAGAKYEALTTPGLSMAMAYALTTSNMENSFFQVDRQIRAHGAALNRLELRKRYVGIRVDARADMWQVPLSQILTGIAVPRFHEADVEKFRDPWDNNFEEMRLRDPRNFAINQVEGLAFYKEPLGQPRHVLPESNDKCNATAMLDYWTSFVQPSRVVIAGVNVEHAQLIAEYENCPFQHTMESPHFARATTPKYDMISESAQFGGGMERMFEENRPRALQSRPDMEPETIVAIAYKGTGVARTAEYAANLVHAELFNQSVENSLRYEHTETHFGTRGFYRPFEAVGIQGVTVRAYPDQIVQATIEANKAFKAVNVQDKAAIEAAKQSAIVAFLGNSTDSHRDYCDYLGTNLSENNLTKPEEIVAAIKTIGTAELKRVVDAANSAKPCMYVMGETFPFPSMRQLGL